MKLQLLPAAPEPPSMSASTHAPDAALYNPRTVRLQYYEMTLPEVNNNLQRKNDNSLPKIATSL